MKNKIMSTLVVLIMVLSTMMVMNTTFNVSVIDNVQGARNTDNTSGGGNQFGVILSNDGTGDVWDYLTCGQMITLQVVNNSLIPDEDYAIKVWNGTHWRACYDDASTDNADEYGDLSIDFYVPGWPELQHNPLTANGTGVDDAAGQWNISLWTESTGGSQVWTDLNVTIQIGNLYDVYFMDNSSSEIEYLIYGEDGLGDNTYGSAGDFNIYVRNWTGDGNWETPTDYSSGDNFYQWDLTITKGSTKVTGYDDKSVGNADSQYVYIDVDTYSPSVEDYFYVNVSSHATASFYSNVTLPVKPYFTIDSLPSNLVWGDTVAVAGYILDANATGLGSKNVALYAPVASGHNGDFVEVNVDSTPANGRYSISAETGPGQGYGAGTWYLGLKNAGNIDEANNLPYVANFVPYYSFELDTKDDAKVTVRNSDDIISGFVQTINVSVYNSSWMNDGSSWDSYNEYENMELHVTGLAGWDGTTEYDDDDIVQITEWKSAWTDTNNKYCYYELNYTFNETGTATVIASWPGNGTSHTLENPDLPGNDSYYSNTYNGDTELLANITGSTTLSVVSPDDMNLVVDGTMVNKVNVDESGNNWKNASQTFWLNIYGDSSSTRMNATLEITGCGLDITIDEDDTTSNENLVSKSNGRYQVKIQPKTAGTLTITATNDTEGTSVSKDYAVTGLTGSVTTSEGDDLKLTVGTTETITATVTNGQFSEVHLTYYDTNWANPNSINTTVGDGTAGDGLNGEFTFVPDEDDLESVGYIVVAAKAGTDIYMYDIIEIEPIYDLEIEMVKPVSTNQTLTVGLEQDFSVQLLGPDGSIVDEDSPNVIGKLTDEDHDEDDPLQTITFTESGDEWEADNIILWHPGTLIISGYNASSGMKHEGNVSIEVDHATISYSPGSATAGIGTRNLTVTITGTDANGDTLPDGTHVYLWCEDSEDTAIGGTAGNTDAVNLKTGDDDLILDEDGQAEFILREVGDNKTSINVTLQDNNPSIGNTTAGKFSIVYPNFALNPDTIYIGQSNDVEITATDTNGDPIYGINLTFVSSVPGILASQPDPVMTNADGIAELSISPQASGKLNVTIARDLDYEDGQLNWTNSVITDSIVTVTSIKAMKISISKSPIYQGETLTVTVTSGGSALSGVDVEFAETTAQTDSNGEATFTVPDPGVESATYSITAEKAGYASADKSITVIKVYSVQIVGPNTAPAPGEEFTVSIIANGQALAGATVEFNGNTYTSNARGELTLTAPDSAGSYTVSASYGNYEDGTLTITIEEGEGGVPGFELLTLVAALGVAFILLRRRRQ